MMNEFPPKYLSVMREASDSDTVPASVTEYLEYLDSIGIKERTFRPPADPAERIWEPARPAIQRGETGERTGTTSKRRSSFPRRRRKLDQQYFMGAWLWRRPWPH